MARPGKEIDRASVKPDDPLRLEVAARLFFPDGSMSASGLRKERNRGRLLVLKIAGKEYTTLAELTLMIERCKVEPPSRGQTQVHNRSRPPNEMSALEAFDLQLARHRRKYQPANRARRSEPESD